MSAQIHPTAIVGPEVQLADDVIIGPSCYLEGRIILGPGSVLLNHVFAKGPLTLGEQNRVYPNVTLGHDPQDAGFDPDTPGAGCIIGDRNTIREGVSIHRATGDIPTTIGDDNMIMAYGHVAHDCKLGNHIVMANNALLGGHCEVQNNVFIGGNGGAHQFCRIGRLAMIGGTNAVSQDVAPFCMVMENRTVTGLNRVGLRRAGMRDQIKSLEQAYNILLDGKTLNANAIAQVREQFANCPACLEMADFVDSSKRGVTRHYNRKYVMMSDRASRV